MPAVFPKSLGHKEKVDLYQTEFKQVNFATTRSTNFVTQKEKQEKTTEAPLPVQSEQEIDFETGLSIFQAYLREITKEIAFSFQIGQELESRVRDIWFMVLRFYGDNNLNLHAFFTPSQTKLYEQQLKNRKSKNPKPVAEPKRINYDFLFNENHHRKESGTFSEIQLTEKHFFGKSRFINPSKKENERQPTQVSRKKQFGVAKLNEKKALLHQLNSIFINNKDVISISEFFALIKDGKVFHYFTIELIVRHFTKILFHNSSLSERTKRNNFFAFVKYFVQYLIPEKFDQIEKIFPFSKSLFYIYVFLVFYFLDATDRRLTLSEINAELAKGVSDFPQTIVAYFQTNMSKLEKLLNFPFEGGNNGPTNNSFIIKRPFLYSIILFAVKTLEIPVYFNDLKGLILSKDFNFNLINDNVKALFDSGLNLQDFKFMTELHFSGVHEGMRFLDQIIKSKVKSMNYLNISFERFLNQFQLPSNIYDRIVYSFQRTVSYFDLTRYVYPEDPLFREDMYLMCAACFAIVSADCEVSSLEPNGLKIETDNPDPVRIKNPPNQKYDTECIANFLLRCSTEGWQVESVMRDCKLRFKLLEGEMISKINVGSLLASLDESTDFLTTKNDRPKFIVRPIVEKTDSLGNGHSTGKESQSSVSRLPIEHYVFKLLNNSSVNSQIYKSLLAEQVVFAQLKDYLSLPIEFHSFVSVY